MTTATQNAPRMRSGTIMAAQTTTGAGAGYRFPANKTIQVDGITTGTVLIQGSNNDSDYYTLATLTSDGLYEVNSPHVFTRANVSVATSVSATVVVGYEEN